MFKLSIIVPIGPTEAMPQALLAAVLRPELAVECLLVSPRPLASAMPPGLNLVLAPVGRGRQQNAGANQSSGDWLWFLHADSQLLDDALEQVVAFIRGAQALGYCRLRFADDGPPLTRLNAMGANLRSRWLGLPYGDQGLCLPRNWFKRLRGFREDLDRGEDLDLVVRAKRAGLPIRCMGPTLTTSARRYQQQGWLRTSVNHQIQAWRLIRSAGR